MNGRRERIFLRQMLGMLAPCFVASAERLGVFDVAKQGRRMSRSSCRLLLISSRNQHAALRSARAGAKPRSASHNSWNLAITSEPESSLIARNVLMTHRAPA